MYLSRTWEYIGSTFRLLLVSTAYNHPNPNSQSGVVLGSPLRIVITTKRCIVDGANCFIERYCEEVLGVIAIGTTFDPYNAVRTIVTKCAQTPVNIFSLCLSVGERLSYSWAAYVSRFMCCLVLLTTTLKTIFLSLL